MSQHRSNGTATPEMHELIVQRMDTPENSMAEIPSKVILVRPTPEDKRNDLLYVDQVPIPREHFSYDPHDKVLRWRGAYGGGDLHFGHDSRGAVGVIGGDALQFVSVQVKTSVTFLCDAALGCGISYITGRGGVITGLHWNPDSLEWKNAKWVKDRFLLHYSSDQSNPLQPPDFTFLFEDLQRKTLPWDPMPGDFGASLTAGDHQGRFVWNLDFKTFGPPPKDAGKPFTGPDSVFPYWMIAREPFSISEISGAMQIDDYAPQGNLAGFRGTRVLPMVAGYYRTDDEHAAFGIFGTHICVDGKPAHRCNVTADSLSWTNLSSPLQQKLGLPAAGGFNFDNSGQTGTGADTTPTIRRLSAAQALQSIAVHQDFYPGIHAAAVAQSRRTAGAGPDMFGLLLMTPFKIDREGAWGDEVQKQVLANMTDIMNSFVSKDLWKRLFPGTPQPTLSGELARVANSPVPGVSNPTEWYKSLSTAVLTQGMAGGVNPNCQYMNGPRADTWLKDQVANSKVYQAHSQLLFRYQWEALNPDIKTYWTDQQKNAGSHAPIIDEDVVKSLLEIDLSVTTDEKTPKDLINRLKTDVQNAGIYAKTNRLYWAFAYYTYNTRPAILAQIGLAIGGGGGADGTILARMIQQHIAVLTALDSSGFFAKQYNTTINTFLTTNILPSMYGFTGEADDFDLIKEYLHQFVAQNILNPDKKIAEAAVQMQAILEAENFNQLLEESLASLRSISGFTRTALALPQIANQWVEWFQTKHPRFAGAANFFGSALLGGMSIMATINLMKQYDRWDQLDKGRRAQVVLDTIQLGLQVFSAVVKRGVRVYAMFNVGGMSAFQRSFGVLSVLGTGNARQLNTGLLSISNRTAHWLGDTAGAASLRQEVTMLMNIGSNEAAAVSWAARIFGKNLNQFIATRLGPLLTLGGIALSIYFIAEGASGVALGNEIMNIAAGSLTMFAMVGGWLIQGGIIAAEGMLAGIISIAGPLAIVCAIVGFGLMFYLMFQKPPDPVEQFVNDYVKPAGLYVSSKCGSIDYVLPYKLDSRNELLMLGSSFSLGQQVLTCQTGGIIGLTNGSFHPECIWKVVTDGIGLSMIATLARLKADAEPIGLLLSLMSDHTIAFQPRVTAAEKDKAADAGPTVLTQTWLTHTAGNATTANGDTALASLPLKVQPVFPNGEGQYRPGQAMGWIVNQGDRLVYSTVGDGTLFTLKMEGIAPNYVTMPELSFLMDSIPDTGQLYGPNYGLMPSSPVAFTEPANLPGFLSFDKQTGVIRPNGNKANEKLDVWCVLGITNTLGKGEVKFKVKVEPAPVKPALA